MAQRSKYQKNGKGPIYESWYRFTTGEREFMLSRNLKDGKIHNISFESPTSAHNDGWRKVGYGRREVYPKMVQLVKETLYSKNLKNINKIKQSINNKEKP